MNSGDFLTRSFSPDKNVFRQISESHCLLSCGGLQMSESFRTRWELGTSASINFKVVHRAHTYPTARILNTQPETTGIYWRYILSIDRIWASLNTDIAKAILEEIFLIAISRFLTRWRSCVEFVLPQVSKSRPGAPGNPGTGNSGRNLLRSPYTYGVKITESSRYDMCVAANCS